MLGVCTGAGLMFFGVPDGMGQRASSRYQTLSSAGRARRDWPEQAEVWDVAPGSVLEPTLPREVTWSLHRQQIKSTSCPALHPWYFVIYLGNKG